MKTNFLNRLLIVCLFALAASTVRADEEQDLIATLQSAAAAPQKCAACQRLRIIGTAKSVPALASLLGEASTSHAARYALEGMPYPEAGAALRQALGTTSGAIKSGLIDSIGWRQDTTALPLLTPLLSDGNTTIASAAASALGKIGGKEAIAALSSVRDSARPAVWPAVLEGLLQCAELLLAGGDANSAAALYQDLFTPQFPEQIRVAAWRGLVIADANRRADRVTQALSGQDRSLQVAALKLIRELNDGPLVTACLQKWTALPPDSQLAVLEASHKLGPNALPTVLIATQNSNLVVRVTTWRALGDLGDPTVIPLLAKTAARGETAEREAARDSLARLRGPGVREALLKYLGNAERPEQAELLRALGERDDTDAANLLLQYAATESGPVRLAALESLRRIAWGDTLASLIDIAAKSKSDSESEPVLKALYAVCQASRDKEQTTRRVLEAMDRIPTAERSRVLPLLAELGTPAALEAAQAATRGPDLELIKQAVRVLSQWPNAAPAPRLLELARASSDPALHALALRGCIELAGHEPNASARLPILRQAMAAARNPAEKKQALGQIGQIPTPEALQIVMADLADTNLVNEAGLAALTIVEKLAGENPKLARETAEKVLAQSKSPEIVKRAWALRSKPVVAAPFIRDWLVCGLYSQREVSGADALFNIAFGPEKPGEAVQWKAMPPGDMANLAAFFPGAMNCAAYLKTRIIAPEDGAAILLLGSDDGVKAWVNGALVHSNNVDRGLVADQDMAPIQLKKGVNELMLKITQGGGGWQACARIIGTDSQPIPGLRFEP